MTYKSSMLLTVNCGFDWQNEITYFAQLSYNEKRELFFRVLWGKGKSSYYFDELRNREQDIRSLDHISFHNDGTVHIRYYSTGKKKEKIYHAKLQNTIPNMSQDVYGPLLVFSVYDIEILRKHIGIATPLIFEDSGNMRYYWEIENTNQFSLVFFLVGANVNYEMMLNTHFPSIFNIAASPFLMNYFGDESKVILEGDEVKKINDLGLLIGYTRKVMPHPSNQALVGPKKSKGFTRIENLLGISLIPSDDKIRQLV